MAKEQIFRSPGFFEREIDLSQRQKAPLGTPGGFIGTALKGPAFVPITVGSFADFRAKLGDMDFKKFGPYAVNEWLKHKTAATYLRVLGAGANDTSLDIEQTRVQGTVKNAGFKVLGTSAAHDARGRHMGAVQFIVAEHDVRADAAFGYPIFDHNDSFPNAIASASLVRGVVFMASGTRLMVMDGDGAGSSYVDDMDDLAQLGTTGATSGKFKLVISSSAPTYGVADGRTALRILTASLNPSANDYISKVLNTDPEKFSVEEHLLYTDYRIEDEIAPVIAGQGRIAVMSGSAASSATSGISGLSFRDMFGRFDTRFRTPTSTWFISQPYGTKEFNLFRFEAISDGKWATDKFKISISNLRKSTDPASEYGTFAVQVRVFDDSDLNPQVIEQFPVCSLDPTSENYIAKIIGDMKAYYQFDADSEDERRVIVHGNYPNRSALIRVVLDEAVEKATLPKTALPFGFRGIPALKTNDTLTDNTTSLPLVGVANSSRLVATGSVSSNLRVNGAIVPPMPFTFKVTRGAVRQSGPFIGYPGVNEITDARLYWGVKTTRVSPTASLDDAVLNPNASSVTNQLVRSHTKFVGIDKLDAVVTGSGADAFCNNKFTLARVALSNVTVADITGTAAQHMKEAAYIRNGKPDPNDYTIDDPSLANRITLGTLVNLTSSVEFNRFSAYAKFTNVLYGGFDGFNILDIDASKMNDRASSSDTGGGATSAFVSPGLAANVNGLGKDSNIVFSYRTATRIMTDELTVNTNLLAIPGIRDSFVTDFAAERCRDNGLIFYVMDTVEYDENLNRLFDDDLAKPDVRKTAEQFDGRALDSNYSATYFPRVVIDDADNKRRVKVPSSIPAVGALAFNDRVGFPWFAPAGFNRGGLDFVSNVDVRLNGEDRDRLQDSHINPIATFPRQGTTPTFVIFGQRTLQQAASALDRVNVRRMLLEVKRIVVNITNNFVFEQNTAATRARWVSQVTPRLALVQTQAGIESFKVTMDETNNTKDDIENNKLNGRIVLIPTRTVEFIAVDFIITNSGIEFVE